MSSEHEQDLFQFADWYDAGINWSARLGREIPVLRQVFGPPGERGLLDLACGPGRHLVAMTQAGYQVTGLDKSEEMLQMARARLAEASVAAKLIQASFDEMPPGLGPFDGAYCLGNSLAAGGDAATVRQAISSLGRVLRRGGKLFIQVLNFEKLRAESPRVRGPRIQHVKGIEYISTRVYWFEGDTVEITNVTLWKDKGWKQHASGGRLYAVGAIQMRDWLNGANLQIDGEYGDYNLTPFETAESNDLIVVATKQ